MKDNFTIPPPQLSDSTPEENGGVQRVKRRAFIKRSGGATVGALVAWNASESARAATSGGCPCSYTWTEGFFTGTVYSPIKTTPSGDISSKVRLDITPSVGYSDTQVTVTARVETWLTSDYAASWALGNPLTFKVTLTGTAPGTKCVSDSYDPVNSFRGGMCRSGYGGANCGYIKVIQIYRACGVLTAIIEFSLSDLHTGPVSGDPIPINIIAW
jgi:hypothetical protein